MLKAENVNVSFGQVRALTNVSIELKEGEIVAIIGANGAGKSSLMRSIMGDVRATSGKITYLDKNLGKMRPHEIVKAGVVYVPEGRQVFAKLSVQDNLEMGAYCRNYSKAELNRHYEEAYTMFPILKDRRKQMAGSLSGGQQQMLALCRGLMSDPKVMLLDEPSLGLAPIIVDEVFETIKSINTRGISVILVEQNAYMALETSARGYVLENGEVILSGPSNELLNNPGVKAAYLGG
ncbi:MAG: ABC transporter ATP-binding protein [Marvinbryantia sp.]|uniref:ABC transporter ATP-binding protein n=1 Tax=Marvinbryantia sp. TaxID=2496532 RepID=UPI002632EEA5|nr:ABC transporter ATP-binding protein [uncultured Marvinbryantia sp.]